MGGRVRMGLLVALVMMAGACLRPVTPRQRDRPSMVEAWRAGGTAVAVRALARQFARWNLPLRVTTGSIAAGADARRRVAEAYPPGGARGPVGRLLLWLLVGRDLALEAQRQHRPLEAGAPSEPYAERLAVALLRASVRENPPLRQYVERALRLLRRDAAPRRRRLPAALRRMVGSFVAGGRRPFGALLRRRFSQSFDRRTGRILLAHPRARVCTLRSVVAPLVSLAGIGRGGRMYVLSRGVVREIPRRGPERRRRLQGWLGRGLVIPMGRRLLHVAARSDRLAVTLLGLGARDVVREGVIEVPGTDFLPSVAVASKRALLAFRRGLSGYQAVRIDLGSRSAQRAGGFPGAAGHRDGRLGSARFSLGPALRMAGRGLVFFDPAARALRVLRRGWVATLVRGGSRRDAGGGEGRVGRVVGLAAGSGDRIYLIEAGDAVDGGRRYLLRLLRPGGGRCTPRAGPPGRGARPLSRTAS